MLRKFKKITRQISFLLLIGIFMNLPIGNNILCIEPDGTSSVESAPLGNCQVSNLSINSTSQTASDHEECIECTDISLTQTLSTKLQSETDYTAIPDTFFIASTSFEIPVYTEPIESIAPNLNFVSNQLHKHLQTIILLI